MRGRDLRPSSLHSCPAGSGAAASCCSAWRDCCGRCSPGRRCPAPLSRAGSASCAAAAGRDCCPPPSGTPEPPPGRCSSCWMTTSTTRACDSLGFCQLFLECPLECCLQRNRLRSDSVPEQTIHLMAKKIEMPDLRKNAWEQHSLILSSSDCISEDNEQIMNLLATALENPERPNEEDTEQKEAARAICAASAVHQADQACRRIISQAMQDAKGKNVLPSEMKSLAEELNKLKTEFLDDLRQGKTLKTQYSDPATSVISSFQHEATSAVNKYIFK